jgi:hypothetical protein
MTDLVVLYDDRLELATLVDMDMVCGLGPTAPGPQGAALLEEFANSAAAFTEYMQRDDLMMCWAQWFQQRSAAVTEATPTPSDSPLEPQSDTGMADAALAEREAADGGAEPPEPQSADTDADAEDQTGTTVIADCYVCDGSGKVAQGDTLVTCNMCQGTGKIQVAAAT